MQVGERNLPTLAGEAVTYSVGIVSDNEIVRFGIKGMLRAISCVRTIADLTYSSPTDVAEIANLDVVLICGEEPDEITRFVTMAKVAGGKVVILLDRQTPHVIHDLLRLEANGYLLMADLGVSKLAGAFAQLQEGQVALSPQILREVMPRASGMSRTAPMQPPELTARELETLTLLVEGLSNKQIARKLDISVHGVKRLVTNILIKLSCPNRTMAVRTAITLGLLAPNAT